MKLDIFNNDKIDNLKYNLLEKEYKILSSIIYKLQYTIIENENILLFSKSQSMKSLNEMIKKMNDIYNKYFLDIYHKENENNNILTNESLYSELMDIKSDENKSDEKDNSLLSSVDSVDTIDKIIDNNKSKSQEKIIKNINLNDIKIENIKNDSKLDIQLDIINDIKKIYYENKEKMNNYGKYSNLIELIKYNPFDDIKKQIILLCKIIGFTSLNDIIYLSLNINNYLFENNENNENNVNSEETKYNFLSSIFVPLDFNLSDTNIITKITINKTDFNNIILINNQCLVEFSINDKLFKIKGYIKNDPLNINIRTSQISNNYLFIKKTRFEEIINYINLEYNQIYIISKEVFNKLQKVNKEFAIIYLKNMTISEILILDDNQFISKIYEDYNKFNDLTKIQFVKLIKNFTKDSNESLLNMYNTIKLLLLGSDENCSVASLLFNLLKDKKNNGSNDYIANIIYSHLNYIGQSKLKKSTFNIKNELDKLKGITTSDIDLKKQVLLSKNMPDHIKKICLEKLEELKNANNETYKIKMYVNILVQFPWLSDSDDNMFKMISTDKKKSKEFLENVESRLDSHIYGHKIAKNKTLQILAKLISVQGSHISPIALSGPPGVGKTKFAQVLADCLDIPFVQITLGGQNDGELLHGHGYTYSGAQPGLIVKKMVDAGSGRCIMYFDELDKCVAKNGQVNELMSILIHLTDPMTNGAFQDRFFQEITFPLNKVIFMFSFNDVSKIDKILLDRMEVLEVGSYSVKEKITIASDYLLKQLCKDVGFEHKSIEFKPDILTKIIEDYTFEPGVRSLKRSLENILLKLNIDKIYQRGIFENDFDYSITNPIKITFEMATEYLGETKVTFKSIHSKDMIGVVNGLYATSLCSGGIVPIQLTSNHMGNNSKFSLKLTGNQKKIMRESILYSFTTAINLLTKEGQEIFFKNYPSGIHIHTPEAATPKDGPSAGVAFTLCFLSMMLGLPIDRTIALTGEIDLYGNVSAIGGVKYKVQGAFKAGVKTVFLPIENKEDLEKTKKELPEIFDETKKYFFIEHVLEVAEKALIGWANQKYLIKK
jgi:endopeptidase La